MNDEFLNKVQDSETPAEDKVEVSTAEAVYEKKMGSEEDFYTFRYRNLPGGTEPQTPSAQEEKKEEAETSASPTKELYFKETIKPKKKHTFGRVVAACMAVAMVGGVFGGAGYAIGQRTGAANATVTAGGTVTGVVQTASSSYNAGGNSATTVINKMASAVVNIKTVVKGEQTYFYGYSIPYEAESAGSGVMFYEDEDKVYVATNNHVVENATTIFVTINDGKDEDEVPATLVGADPSSDLAVISIQKSDLQAAGVSSVTIAVFGDSDKLEVGQDIIVIGNALGTGQSSTGGWISALQKSITIDGVTLDVLQTDAAINPGNSGGALINYNGEVVGIPTAKSTEKASEGMGYAIPSNVAVPIIEELLQNGSVAKPYLGIAGQDVTEEISEMYRLPVGVLIREVVEGSGAALAGIEQGDIITGFNGKEITSMTALQEEVSNCEIGDTVSVEVYRGGQGNSNMLTLKVSIQNANA